MAVEPFTHPSEAAWPPGSAHHLVIGAPQSGKTTLAVNAFVDHVRSHGPRRAVFLTPTRQRARSEEHTSELQSRFDLVCRLLLEKKNLTALRSSYGSDTLN